MESLITPSNVMFSLGIIGILFAVYKQFHEPQEALETKQAISEKDISSKATILAQKELETKALVLAEQVEWEKVANEKKFTEFGIRLDAVLAMAQNHIHTVDTKVDSLILVMNENSKEMTRLSTIIEERIPRKV